MFVAREHLLFCSLPVQIPDISGDYVSCTEDMAAFGRCQTSSKNHSGGDCNNLSHQVKCCESDAGVNSEKCGWLYAQYGVEVRT